MVLTTVDVQGVYSRAGSDERYRNPFAIDIKISSFGNRQRMDYGHKHIVAHGAIKIRECA